MSWKEGLTLVYMETLNTTLLAIFFPVHFSSKLNLALYAYLRVGDKKLLKTSTKVVTRNEKNSRTWKFFSMFVQK